MRATSGWISGLVALVLGLPACIDERPSGYDAGVIHPERPPLDRVPGETYFCDLPAPDVTRAGLPYGFCIRRFAGIAAPRVLAFAPNGDLFVSSPGLRTPGLAPPGTGQIAVLTDDNRDGVAEITEFAGGLPDVHGLLFTEGWLYYTRNTGVFRVPYVTGQRRIGPTAPEQVVALVGLSLAPRWTHTLARSADGTIYVSQGQYQSYTCPATPREGAVFRLQPGSLTPVLVASGFRNPLYLRCDPAGVECYAAELSDDSWHPTTGVQGREKLVRLGAGGDYGYPCCAGPNDLAPPGRGRSANCAAVAAELTAWPLHDTPFGIDFERGRWPEPWRNGFFVGLHGAFETWENTKLIYSPLDANGRPSGQWRDFVTGWGRNPQGIVGRVTDVTFAADGRLFFSDDQGGGVYWVAPEGMAVPPQ
ncbi:MAG: hypothetical protein Q8S73_12125 [Deltaproteobacteria bacterium]|nr:hypothetical protein [Myxococcales bacterium]MDP3214846.1 hypothetical protein [Deltaproteobacteria bacterium]